MTLEAIEPEGIKDIDVAKIAARLKGWILKESQTRSGSWLLSIKTRDEKHLILNINADNNSVAFKELDTRGALVHHVQLGRIDSVEFEENELGEKITFKGFLNYEISMGGVNHRLINPRTFNEFVSRTYVFPLE